jgi:hypothetical protein
MNVERPSAPKASGSDWREDDNGNRFGIARKLARKAAASAVKEFEERGHKQAYWFEPTRRD